MLYKRGKINWRIIALILLILIPVSVIAFQSTSSSFTLRFKQDSGAGTNASSLTLTQRFIFGNQPVNQYNSTSFSGRFGILEDLLNLAINMTFPLNNVEIIRGSDSVDNEDDIGLVENNLTIISKIFINETGQGISSINTSFFFNTTNAGSNLSNGSGFVSLQYDKSERAIGIYPLFSNYSTTSYINLIQRTNVNISLISYRVPNFPGNKGVASQYVDGQLAILYFNITKTNETGTSFYSPKNISVNATNAAMNPYPDSAYVSGKRVYNTTAGQYESHIIINSSFGSAIRWGIYVSDNDFSSYIATAIQADIGVTNVPICGNTLVETGETCDDGNILNGDGCSATCATEGGGDGCFLAGTLITLSNGMEKPIEDVRVGDKILGYNEDTGKNEISKVIQTFIHNNKSYLILNGKLKVTPNHPLLINGLWNRADSVKIGDSLKDVNGKDVLINSIEKGVGEETVYNLEVENTHTYYAENILVHNKGGDTCSNECPSLGQIENVCVTGLTLRGRTCGNYDSDSCLEWGNLNYTDCTDLGENYICENAECVISDCEDSWNCGEWSECFLGDPDDYVSLSVSSDNLGVVNNYVQLNNRLDNKIDNPLISPLTGKVISANTGQGIITGFAPRERDVTIKEQTFLDSIVSSIVTFVYDALTTSDCENIGERQCHDINEDYYQECIGKLKKEGIELKWKSFKCDKDKTCVGEGLCEPLIDPTNITETNITITPPGLEDKNNTIINITIEDNDKPAKESQLIVRIGQSVQIEINKGDDISVTYIKRQGNTVILRAISVETNESNSNFTEMHSVRVDEVDKNRIIVTVQSDPITKEIPVGGTVIFDVSGQGATPVAPRIDEVEELIQVRVCSNSLCDYLQDRVEVRSCEEECVPDWQCSWTVCTEEDIYSYPYNCVDYANNRLGCDTNKGKPGKLLCGQQPDLYPDCSGIWACSEWNECKIDYSIKDVLAGDIPNQGSRTRTCYDKQGWCINNFTEIGFCDYRIPISINRVEWCSQNYLEIYDLFTSQLISRIKESDVEGYDRIMKLDISFITTKFEGYCDYCFDGVKNYDEESVDCGGPSCPACLRKVKFFDWLFWLRLFLWTIFIMITLRITDEKLEGLKERKLYARERIIREKARGGLEIGADIKLRFKRFIKNAYGFGTSIEQGIEFRVKSLFRKLTLPRISVPSSKEYKEYKGHEKYREKEIIRPAEREKVIVRPVERVIMPERIRVVPERELVEKKIKVPVVHKDSRLIALENKLRKWKKEGYYGVSKIEEEIKKFRLKKPRITFVTKIVKYYRKRKEDAERIRQARLKEVNREKLERERIREEQIRQKEIEKERLRRLVERKKQEQAILREEKIGEELREKQRLMENREREQKRLREREQKERQARLEEERRLREKKLKEARRLEEERALRNEKIKEEKLREKQRIKEQERIEEERLRQKKHKKSFMTVLVEKLKSGEEKRKAGKEKKKREKEIKQQIKKQLKEHKIREKEHKRREKEDIKAETRRVKHEKHIKKKELREIHIKKKIEQKHIKIKIKTKKKEKQKRIKVIKREIRNKKIAGLIAKLRLWRKEGYYGTAKLEEELKRLKESKD